MLDLTIALLIGIITVLIDSKRLATRRYQDQLAQYQRDLLNQEIHQTRIASIRAYWTAAEAVKSRNVKFGPWELLLDRIAEYILTEDTMPILKGNVPHCKDVETQRRYTTELVRLGCELSHSPPTSGKMENHRIRIDETDGKIKLLIRWHSIELEDDSWWPKSTEERRAVIRQ